MMKVTCAVALATLAVAAAASDDKSCFLLGGRKAAKPFPSLTQCYKQNQQACCVSAHDDTIGGEYGGILSGTCVREYGHLEQYYCLGCDPDSDMYIDYYVTNSTTAPGSDKITEYHKKKGNGDVIPVTNELYFPGDGGLDKPKTSTKYQQSNGKYGMIKLCKSFADKLLYADGANSNMDVDAYDGCGMMGVTADGNGVLSRLAFALTDEEKTGPGSFLWGTTVKTTPEYKFFDTLRPTYFGKDDFDISWNHPSGTGADGTPTCFGAGNNLHVGFMAVALVALVAQRLA